MLDTVFLAEPRSRVVQEIICNIFIYAVPAEMDKQHALDLSKDQEHVRVFMTDKTPARHVLLMKLVIFCVVVFCGHGVCSVMIYRNQKSSRASYDGASETFFPEGWGTGNFNIQVVPSPSFDWAPIFPP